MEYRKINKIFKPVTNMRVLKLIPPKSILAALEIIRQRNLILDDDSDTVEDFPYTILEHVSAIPALDVPNPYKNLIKFTNRGTDDDPKWEIRLWAESSNTEDLLQTIWEINDIAISIGTGDIMDKNHKWASIIYQDDDNQDFIGGYMQTITEVIELAITLNTTI